MPFAAQTLRQVRVGLRILLPVLLLMAPSIAHAEGEDPAVIEKITSLNKKALDAYDALEFEDARKLLKQALDLCSSAGLDKHPIKARTHIHMGVVLIAAKQQELGTKQFRKALEIQPDIQVTKALANPEILQAFEEAGAGLPPPTAGNEPAEPPPGGGAGSPPPPQGAPEEPADITHMSISRGKKGKPISISATVSPDLTGYTKLVIAYRAQGAPEFIGVDMRRSGNRFVGEIPADATQGNSVAYYIEAEAEDETAVATTGSEDRPYTVSLSDKTRIGDEEGDEDSDDDAPRFFVALMGGTGIGYATGNGEVNADNKVNAGFAPSSAMQLAPEIGYFISPDLRLSLQLRWQLVRGATPQNLEAFIAAGGKANIDSCGPDRLCSPATSAIAVFARAAYFFGSGSLRPYVSGALGGGEIRHIVKFTSLRTSTNPGTCGKSGTEACVDTVVAGPVFLGPGAGILYGLGRNFGLVAELGTLFGFPKFTFHLDFNGGVAGRF